MLRAQSNAPWSFAAYCSHVKQVLKRDMPGGPFRPGSFVSIHPARATPVSLAHARTVTRAARLHVPLGTCMWMCTWMCARHGRGAGP